jgi:pilus assembly protein CpaB
VASGEVKVPAGADPAQEKQMLLAIANRPSDSNTTFTTGGDVSRFQRRSVPARTADRGDQALGALTNLASAIRGGPAPASSAGGTQAYSGPVVRVARGNNVTVVPVGAR